MPKKVFTVKNTGQIVEIQYNWLWRNIVVRLGDRDIGHFKNMRPLKEGQLLKSPIGDIHVQYKQTMLTGSGFEVWHDNNALNGSLSDPVQYWRTGYKTALFLGLFNIVIGGITLLTKNSLLASIGAGPYSLVFGVVLLFLGLWSWRRRSGLELALAAFIIWCGWGFRHFGVDVRRSFPQYHWPDGSDCVRIAARYGCLHGTGGRAAVRKSQK